MRNKPPTRIPSKEPICCEVGSRLPWPTILHLVGGGTKESRTSLAQVVATPKTQNRTF